MMDQVAQEVAVVNMSGEFSPALYAQPESLRGYIVAKGYSPCPNQTIESIDLCWHNIDTQIFLSPASITSSGNNQYVLNDTFDKKKQNLVLFYDVDQNQLNIKSLKSLLRDMCCCSLGSRIFPVASDTWSIVTYYCEETTKWLDFYKAGNYPTEFTKIKPKQAFGSIRVVRS
jgi:hypothetical protein